MIKTVTCINVGSYEEALVKGKSYEVLMVDDFTKQIKIRDKNNRLRWYPMILFDLQGESVPFISEWKYSIFDGEQSDDWVEITIQMTDGTRRWCSFATPSYFQRRLNLQGSDPGFWSDHTIIIRSISQDIIDEMLKFLDQRGELLKASVLLKYDESTTYDSVDGDLC